MDSLKYPYSKKRSEFGKPCFFHTERASITCQIEPDEDLRNEFQLATTVNRGKQTGVEMALSQVNTIRAQFKESGINHTEGGWPRDVNPNDIEATSRYKKKLERDEQYAPTILRLASTLEHLVLQNNTIDIYKDHFGAGDSDDENDEDNDAEYTSATVLNTYHDPLSHTRSINDISWCPGTRGRRAAAAYVDYRFHTGNSASDRPADSYIWDTENPYEPESRVSAGEQLLSLQYSPKHSTVLAAGTDAGSVCWFDTRRGPGPVERTPLQHRHRGPAHNAVWLSSKSGTELFSAGVDGIVQWWDTRQLSEPQETLLLQVPKQEQQPGQGSAQGATALEYEPTMPTRFMVGTERGYVLVCNRRGKSHAEKIPAHFAAHSAQIRRVERNPTNLKTFLTVGDRCARIWSEDCRDSAVCWVPSDGVSVNDGTWSPTRPSTLYTVREDGTLTVWDLIRQQSAPVLALKLSERPLQTVRVHHTGTTLAVGGGCGTLTVLHTSSAVISRDRRNFLAKLFDHERAREKVIDLKLKEIRLMHKNKDDVATSVSHESGGGNVGELAGEKREQEQQIISDTHSHYGEQVKRTQRRRQLQWQRLYDIGLVKQPYQPETDQVSLETIQQQ